MKRKDICKCRHTKSHHAPKYEDVVGAVNYRRCMYRGCDCKQYDTRPLSTKINASVECGMCARVLSVKNVRVSFHEFILIVDGQHQCTELWQKEE